MDKCMTCIFHSNAFRELLFAILEICSVSRFQFHIYQHVFGALHNIEKHKIQFRFRYTRFMLEKLIFSSLLLCFVNLICCKVVLM